MRLYGVWIADYSQSSVEGRVFTSQDEAEAVCRAMGGSLVEFELDAPLTERERSFLRPGERVYLVTMDADGDNAQAWPVYEEQETSRLGVRSDGGRVNGFTWATSEQQAIALVNARRFDWIERGKPRPTERLSGTRWGLV